MRYFALLLVLFAAGAAAAASFDAPKRKSGLWELKISSGQTKRQSCGATVYRRENR